MMRITAAVPDTATGTSNPPAPCLLGTQRQPQYKALYHKSCTSHWLSLHARFIQDPIFRVALQLQHASLMQFVLLALNAKKDLWAASSNLKRRSRPTLVLKSKGTYRITALQL